MARCFRKKTVQKKFGALGECTKHAYEPFPTAHNALFSYKLGQKEFH
jgi:hypothetical protein